MGTVGANAIVSGMRGFRARQGQRRGFSQARSDATAGVSERCAPIARSSSDQQLSADKGASKAPGVFS
jgi:hypothetical protein